MASRKAERHVLQVPGHIIIDGIPYPCTVYDRSITGARIVNFGNIELPAQFLIQSNSPAQPCWLIWRDEREAGLSFSAPEAG